MPNYQYQKGGGVLLAFFEKINSNLFLENRLLRLTVVAIGLGQIYLGAQVNEAMKSQRTILVPAGLDHRVMVTGDYASEEYVKFFARNICNLAFTYSTATARSQFGELLQMFTPEGFVATKQTLHDLATTIETTRTSSVFIPGKITVDAEHGKISVDGTQRIWVDSTFIDTQAKSYSVGYKLNDGKFVVTSLGENRQHAPVAAPVGNSKGIQVAPNSTSPAPAEKMVGGH